MGLIPGVLPLTESSFSESLFCLSTMKHFSVGIFFGKKQYLNEFIKMFKERLTNDPELRGDIACTAENSDSFAVKFKSSGYLRCVCFRENSRGSRFNQVLYAEYDPYMRDLMFSDEGTTVYLILQSMLVKYRFGDSANVSADNSEVLYHDDNYMVSEELNDFLNSFPVVHKGGAL